MHDSTHETGKSRRKIDFFNTEQQTQAKHSRLLKTPTEPFGIVLLETQYSAEKNQVGINKQTNCIKTVFWPLKNNDTKRSVLCFCHSHRAVSDMQIFSKVNKLLDNDRPFKISPLCTIYN